MHCTWNPIDRRPRQLSWPVRAGLLAVLLPVSWAWCGRECVAAPAPDTAQPLPALQLEDPAEPLVPLNPRTERDEDHIRALALFAAARVAEQKQDYELALRNYQRAYRFDPNAVAALREIVPLAFNLDRQEEGVRYALVLAERDPVDPTMLRRLAIYLTEGGDTARALGLYEQANSLQEADDDKPTAETVMTWLEMGRLYFIAKDFEQAARYFEKVSAALDKPEQYKLPPAAQKALLSKGDLTYQLFGEAFLEAKRPQDALAAFEKANGLKADEARHLYNLARVRAAQKQPAQALARLDEYLAGHFATQGTGPYELTTEMLAAIGQEDQLIERLARNRSEDSDNLPLSYFLAEQYRKAGQLDKAEPIFAELIANRAERPPLEAIIGLVEVYRQQADADKLLKLLGQLAERVGSLAPLGETRKSLAADAKLAPAVVAAARKQLDDDAQLDYGQALAAALLALELKDYDTAETLFDAALKKNAAQASGALINWGLELFMAGQYDRAAAVFTRGLDEKILPTDNAAIYFYLAGALEMSKRTDEAIERATQAAELDKDSARFASRIPWIQFHAKRYDDAQRGYRALLDKFDKKHDSAEVREAMSDARLVLSNIAAIQGDMAEAEEWLEQVLDEFPEDTGALNDLGYLWADAGKHLHIAQEMIEKAVDEDPKNMAYRDSLGWVLFRLGKYPEAVAELSVAASGPSPDGVVLDHLAEALAKNGRTAEAIEAWQRAADAFQESSQPDKAAAVREKIQQAKDAPAATPAADSPPADESQARQRSE